MKLPVLFIGHGSPLNAIRDSAYTEEWQNYGDELLDEYDGEIESILCISSQWQTEGTRVTSAEQPPTLHDFDDFPDELYRINYPAEGNPELAARIVGLLGEEQAATDPQRGQIAIHVHLSEAVPSDHAPTTRLHLGADAADIPVVQMSLDSRLNAQGHFDLAAKLAPLRKEGVLIVAAGNIVSNLPLQDWQHPDRAGNAYPWADLAHELVNKWITGRRYDRLLDEAQYPVAIRQAFHNRQNLYPLLYALALRGEKEPIEFFNDEIIGKSVSMTSLVIGFV